MRVNRHYGTSNDVALPAAMAALLMAFYATVFMIPHYGFAEARDDGWLAPKSESAGIVDTLSLYVMGRVYWLVAARAVTASWVSMTLVVSFSSCLDLAAIEVDLRRALDMDKELQTVGLSNIISGLCGGFTGSYIFSQTIFTCRTGAHSRFVGLSVAIAEIAIVVSPTNPSASLPLYFFASMLAFVGIDLLVEWLWDARFKFSSRLEYASSVFTFVAIQVFGIDNGLLIGLLFSSGVFMVSAANLSEKFQPLIRIAPVYKATRRAQEARTLERFKDQ